MPTSPATPSLRDKLAATSLFQTYGEAFAKVSGCTLSLLEDDPDGVLSVPVRVGRRAPLFLVVDSANAGSELQIRALLKSFALQLGEEANRAMLQPEGALPVTVRAAMHYIAEHLGEKIHLDDVAEAVGVCSFQLCRLFKAHTGITMTEYVSRQRVEQAKKRLEHPGRQISSIAYEVGFSSLSQFNRNFLKYTGESPTRYRVRLEELEHCALAAV